MDMLFKNKILSFFLAQPHIEGMRRREKKLRHNGAKPVRMATDFLV